MHDNPLQYSCLEKTLAREAWQDTVLRVAESDIIKVTFSMYTHTHTHTEYTQDIYTHIHIYMHM